MPQGIVNPIRLPLFVKGLIFSPAVILAASAARLIFISNYDTTTATTIASTGGVTGTLLGTTVPLLPPYLPIIALLLALWRQWPFFWIAVVGTILLSPAYNSPDKAYAETKIRIVEFSALIRRQVLSDGFSGAGDGLINLAKDGSVFWPAVYVCAWLVFAVLYAYSHASSYDGLFFAPQAVFLTRLLGGLAIGFLALYAVFFIQVTYKVPYGHSHFSDVARTPWLPAEELTLESSKTKIGYVLGTKDGWFVVLKNEDRRIEYIKSGDIKERNVCSIENSIPDHSAPLYKLENAKKPNIDECGEPDD